MTVDQPLDVVMVDGIDRFCLREIALAREARESRWKRDVSSPEAFEKSLAPYREAFSKIIGAVDKRVEEIQFERPLPEPGSHV